MSTGSILPIKCNLKFTNDDRRNHVSNPRLSEDGTYSPRGTIMEDEVNRVCDVCGQENRCSGSKMLRKCPWIDRCRKLKWTLNNSTRIYLNSSGSRQGPGVGSCERGNELSLSRNCEEFV